LTALSTLKPNPAIMKKTLISVFMLALSPVLLAQAPAVVSEATPLVEGAGTVDILKADGTVLHGRKILGMTPDALRLMTDDGIRKIPLDTLHPNSLTKLASMMESPEEQQARLQREAAAAQTYRENQALKERMTAEENAQRGASMRADEARQEAARQAAAAAYAQQQLAAQEMLRQMDAAKAQRRDERAARIAAADREDAMRQQQYEREMAAANAAAAAAAAQRAAAQPVGPGPLAAMMPAHTREASGVDKLDLNEQTALKGWVDHPSKTPLPTHTWEPKLTPTEKQALTTWLDQKWFANLPPAMRMQMPGGADAHHPASDRHLHRRTFCRLREGADI